jgi:hypothetical protein
MGSGFGSFRHRSHRPPGQLGVGESGACSFKDMTQQISAAGAREADREFKLVAEVAVIQCRIFLFCSRERSLAPPGDVKGMPQAHGRAVREHAHDGILSRGSPYRRVLPYSVATQQFPFGLANRKLRVNGSETAPDPNPDGCGKAGLRRRSATFAGCCRSPDTSMGQTTANAGPRRFSLASGPWHCAGSDSR